MNKKIVVATLLLSMSLAFTACNSDKTGDEPVSTGNTSTEEPSKAAESTETNTTEPTSGPMTGAEYIKTLPKLSEELVEFNIVNVLQPEQMEFGDMEFFQALEEATNVRINWQGFPSATYNDQKNIMLASDDLPDAFFGYDSLSMADLNQYGPMGMFQPVDELIEKYGTNYKQRLAEEPILDGLSTAFDGKKYSWGTVNESPARDFPDNLYINKTWLDNLGLEMPTNMEEYYEVLKAFKTEDPNGNGIADEIPYTFTNFHHIQGYGSFFGAWGQAETFNGSPTSSLNHFIVEDDTVKLNAISEEYKTGIIELQKFFAEGLFDNEGFIQDGSQFLGKVTQATPIVGSMYIWDLTQLSEENKAQYVALKPLKATETSDEPFVRQRRNHISIQPMGLAITYECENVEILAQWIDLFYSDEISIISSNGLDCIIEDGVFTYSEEALAGGKQTLETPFDGAPKYMTHEKKKELVPASTVDDAKATLVSEYYSSAKNITLSLPSMNFTIEENEFLNSYGMNIQNKVAEMQSLWLLGTSDIEADWDNYLAELEQLEVQKLIDTMQAAYDRTIAK